MIFFFFKLLKPHRSIVICLIVLERVENTQTVPGLGCDKESYFQFCLLNMLQVQHITQALPSVFFPFLFPLLRLTSLSSGGIWAIFCINTFSSSSAINTMSSPGCKIWSVPFSQGEAAVLGAIS